MLCKQPMQAEEIIAEAKRKCPVSVYIKGRLSPEDREIIQKKCRISTMSVYMDGSATYSILYDERLETRNE